MWMKEDYKTFKEILEEVGEDNLYPEKVDDATRKLVYDWFQYRKVCDNEKFPLFFNRRISHEYDRYQQLLRIEPGVSKYDWLVSEYKEMKSELLEKVQSIGELMGETGRDSNITNNKDINVITNTDELQEHRGNDTLELDTNQDRTATNKKTGSETTNSNGTSNELKTGSENVDTTGTNTNEKTGTQSVEGTGKTTLKTTGTDDVADSGTTTLTKTGSDTTTRTPELDTKTDVLQTTTRGQAIETTRATDTSNSSESQTKDASDTISMNKALPQEVSGAGGKITVEGVPVFQGPNFDYATEYAEQTNQNSSLQTQSGSTGETMTETTTPLTGSDKVETGTTQKQTGTDKSETKYNTTEETTLATSKTTTYDTEQDQNVSTTETTTYNITDKETLNTKNKTTYDVSLNNTNEENKETEYNITDTLTENTKETGTNKTLYNSDLSTDKTETSETKSNAKIDSNSTMTTKQNKTGTTDTNSTNYNITTGRNEDPATILFRAARFIKETEAWDWLRERLETCFLAVYDI